MDKVYQKSVFDEYCACNCEAYASCGGRKLAAPCQCIWETSSERYHQCKKCNIICREKENFLSEMANGLSLGQIELTHSSFGFPIHIPSYTEQYSDANLFSFVAVDIRMLFKCRRKRGAELKDNFSSEQKVRKHLNVNEKCKLIAVLNGEDWMLESFWAANRVAIFRQLASVGFEICSGPTFSVTALTSEGKLTPYFHNVVMLMRHHRVLSEITDAGLCAIPNLYWLDGDEIEMTRWSTWLKNNAGTSIISKDLTSTRRWPDIERKLQDLVILLRKTGRSFSILIVGTGHANAGKVVAMLTQAGHKVSIVTSAPIMKAIKGGKYVQKDNGLGFISCDKNELSKIELMRHNLSLYEMHLTACCLGKAC